MNKTLSALNMGPLRKEADDAPEGGGGLIAGLSDFIDNEDSDPAPIEEAPIVESTKEVSPEAAIVDDDLGLPGLPSSEEPVTIEPDAPSFDEAKFDAETSALIKTIEEKGHAGDVYKDLRLKLKELEQKGAAAPGQESRIAELEKQNLELSESAAQVKALEERVANVTSRSAELLLEENADYQARVSTPYGEITDTVKAMAEAKGIPEVDLWEAIKENDPVKRIGILDELERKIGGRYALEVGNMSKDIRTISALDKEMRSNAEAIVAAAKEKEAGASTQELESKSLAYKASARTSFERYASKIPGFTDSTGNMTDEARVAMGKAQIVNANSLGSDDLGYMAFAVNALPQVLNKLRAMEGENRDLRVASGQKVGIAGGAPVDKVKEASDSGEPKGFLDSFNAQRFTAATQ